MRWSVHFILSGNMTSHDNNVDQWKKHYVAMVEGKVTPFTPTKKAQIAIQGRNPSMFTVNSQYGGGEQANMIELVSPVTQTVERAKAIVKRSIKKEKQRRQPVDLVRSVESTTRRKPNQRNPVKRYRKKLVKPPRRKVVVFLRRKVFPCKIEGRLG